MGYSSDGADMGYRSDVGLVIRRDEKGAIKIPELLAMAKVAGVDPAIWEGADRVDSEDDVFVFLMTDTKWYDDYPEVKALEKLMEIAEKAEGFSYRFVRIGEEEDDIETKVHGDDPPYDCIGLDRSIAMNV